MQTYAAAHTHTHSFPHTCSPMGSVSADTKKLSQKVKGHPGRGQIRTLGFFSVSQADIPSLTHTHTFSTPAILLLCSVGQAGSRWATTRGCLKEQDHITQEPQAKQIFTCTKQPHQKTTFRLCLRVLLCWTVLPLQFSQHWSTVPGQDLLANNKNSVV